MLLLKALHRIYVILKKIQTLKIFSMYHTDFQECFVEPYENPKKSYFVYKENSPNKIIKRKFSTEYANISRSPNYGSPSRDLPSLSYSNCNEEDIIDEIYRRDNRRKGTNTENIALNAISRPLELFQSLPLPRLSFTTTCICFIVAIFFSPRPFVENFIFPTFRLTFGTLYPAYASYKAVRTKNVKEYVSCQSDYYLQLIYYLYYL